ncbi:MAG: ceramidase domain-containing protein [Actinomycetota bacterium]
MHLVVIPFGISVVGNVRTADFSTLLNVLTSIPFLVLGVSGISSIGDWRIARRLPFAAFVLSLIPVGIGSILYHWSPSTGHLLLDRLPISICLAAFACTVVNEYFQTSLGSALLAPAVLFSAASVLYWYFTATNGRENLVPYAAMQGCTAGFSALIVFTRPDRTEGVAGLRWALAVYAVARIVEFFQQDIYRSVGTDIGHPMKHLLVCLAALLVIRSLGDGRSRQPEAGIVS